MRLRTPCYRQSLTTSATRLSLKGDDYAGPNRSTGLGQLTAGQSRGTRRHAALTADPREPIASIRVPSCLPSQRALSTLSLTRNSQSLRYDRTQRMYLVSIIDDFLRRFVPILDTRIATMTD